MFVPGCQHGGFFFRVHAGAQFGTPLGGQGFEPVQRVAGGLGGRPEALVIAGDWYQIPFRFDRGKKKLREYG